MRRGDRITPSVIIPSMAMIKTMTQTLRYQILRGLIYPYQYDVVDVGSLFEQYEKYAA